MVAQYNQWDQTSSWNLHVYLSGWKVRFSASSQIPSISICEHSLNSAGSNSIIKPHASWLSPVIHSYIYPHYWALCSPWVMKWNKLCMETWAQMEWHRKKQNLFLWGGEIQYILYSRVVSWLRFCATIGKILHSAVLNVNVIKEPFFHCFKTNLL